TIKIVTLPTHGTLLLDGAAVTANETLLASQLGNLTYTPNAGATSDGFTWTGESKINGSSSDLDFAATPATISLTLTGPSVTSFSVQTNTQTVSNISLSTFSSHF